MLMPNQNDTGFVVTFASGLTAAISKMKMILTQLPQEVLVGLIIFFTATFVTLPIYKAFFKNYKPVNLGPLKIPWYVIASGATIALALFWLP